ncbi:hypothetical protein Hanom_Chr11g00993771 [Helianthus anomalus]
MTWHELMDNVSDRILSLVNTPTSLGLFRIHFGWKMSWVFSFHADPVLSNPNPCIRTLYNYLLS